MFARNVRIAGVFVVGLAASTTAESRGGPGFGPDFLGQPPAVTDTNNDGRISAEEVKAARTAEFKLIDSDSDGYATLDELQTWFESKLNERFKALDTDSNQAISATEFGAGKTGRAAKLAARLFKLSDTNNDGGLSLDEFKAVGPGAAKEAVMVLTRHDSDDDDKVSETEYTANLRGHGHRGLGPRF